MGFILKFSAILQIALFRDTFSCLVVSVLNIIETFPITCTAAKQNKSTVSHILKVIYQQQTTTYLRYIHYLWAIVKLINFSLGARITFFFLMVCAIFSLA